MNLVDIKVLEVLGKPRQSKDKRYWTVSVKVNSWGKVYETSIIKPTKNEIEAVGVGYTYQG